MPVIQQFQPGPNFGSELGRVLGTALTDVGMGAAQGFQNQRDRTILEKILPQISDPSVSPLQRASMLSQIPKSYQDVIPRLFQQAEATQVSQAKNQKSDPETLQTAVSEMSDILKRGNLGRFSGIGSIFGKQTQHDTQAFDTLAGRLEGVLRNEVLSGALSKDRFKYLLSLLPSSKKTDSANIAALESFSKEFGLKQPEFEELKSKKGLSEPKELKPGQSFDKLPSSSEVRKGAIVKDSNGNTYIFDGERWSKR